MGGCFTNSATGCSGAGMSGGRAAAGDIARAGRADRGVQGGSAGSGIHSLSSSGDQGAIRNDGGNGGVDGSTGSSGETGERGGGAGGTSSASGEGAAGGVSGLGGVSGFPAVSGSTGVSGATGASSSGASGVIRETQDGEWPWFVRVTPNDDAACEGALIAPEWVLTSASCLGTTEPGSYAVHLRNGNTVPAREAIIHPAFVADPQLGNSFDVAMIHLETALTSCCGVDFIRPSAYFIGSDTPVTLGSCLLGESRPVLQSPEPFLASLATSSTACSPRYDPVPGQAPSDELCASVLPSNTNLCFAGTGSPLVIETLPGLFEHVAVSSSHENRDATVSCSTPVHFVRTSAFINWVRNRMPDTAALAAASSIF
jgi:hypothetical protein